jgi:formylglycine-generating enzyme required for sulfatase activity
MKKLIIFSLTCLLCPIFGAAPLVSNITASQKVIDGNKTKSVDIQYDLQLDSGQKAFVEIWFSPDGGLNFPVRCQDVTGDVDANVSTGTQKTVIWNAESDWNDQFTNKGKIRVIATYGDQPSGYNGSGGGAGGGSDSESAGLKEVFMDVLFVQSISDSAGGGAPGGGGAPQWEDTISTHAYPFHKVHVDKNEITNAKWNEVAQWALANGYSGLPLAPSGEPNDMPRSGITFWDAIKWCNARSEKEGLTPAYHNEATELGYEGDANGDGQISNSGDMFSPYSPDDTNGNGRWDTGESFTDGNGDGVYTPDEYIDFNNNNQYDAGLTTAFKTAAKIEFQENPTGPSADFFFHIDNNATGYRLPDTLVFQKLATGGASQKLWPWGDSPPTSHPTFTQEYVVSFTSDGPDAIVGTADDIMHDVNASPVGSRPANGLGVRDVIGNMAEWTEDMMVTAGVAGGESSLSASVFGGSFVGLDSADVALDPSDPNYDPAAGSTPKFAPGNSDGGMGVTTPQSLFDLLLYGNPEDSSPAVGLRTARYFK